MFRLARRIEQAVAGAPLREIWFAFPHLQQRVERLAGRQIERVHTLGKALLIRFEDGPVIYTHNQLYGRWMFSPPDRRPDTRRQLRLALSTQQRSALLYSASAIEWIEADSVDDHPFMRRAGLDILASGVEPEAVAAWVSQPQFARRRLGQLLLDQSFLAGVGNYLRSEILYLAGVHPAERPMDLGPVRLRSLAVAAHTLMWRSVETGGLTNDPDRVAELKAAGWRRGDYRHYVFGRAGQASFDTEAPIVREQVAGRRLYRCPVRQPVPGESSLQRSG